MEKFSDAVQRVLQQAWNERKRAQRYLADTIVLGRKNAVEPSPPGLGGAENATTTHAPGRGQWKTVHHGKAVSGPGQKGRPLHRDSLPIPTDTAFDGPGLIPAQGSQVRLVPNQTGINPEALRSMALCASLAHAGCVSIHTAVETQKEGTPSSGDDGGLLGAARTTGGGVARGK